MKYTVSITINLPRKRVVELFDNPDNLKLWMDGLQSFEPINGIPGQPGAKARLKFKMGKREIEMIETVTVRNLPEEFSGTYETKGVFNTVRNRFVEKDADHTEYITEQEFQFGGFMKLFGLLMPGEFKKQSQKYLEDFKQFAENRR
jgi:carbon monoxide dehydrogenase subunit G